MARKRYMPEEIIQHLRTAELEQSKGTTQEEAARELCSATGQSGYKPDRRGTEAKDDLLAIQEFNLSKE